MASYGAGMGTKSWAEGIEARPIAKGDAAAWADLLAAAEKVDDTGEHYDADDLDEELDDPKLNAPTDTFALWSGERMAGYAVGARLLDWTGTRGQALHDERRPDLPGELHISVADGNDGQRTMIESAGFEPVRYFFEMKLELDGRPDAGDVVPESLRLLPFDRAYDEATRVAHNEAFRDHWGTSPRDEEMWRTWFTGARAFRAQYSRLLLDGDGEVAAYVLGYEFAADTEATGVRELYIGQVGTRRPYRGRGAANALLASTLAAAAADGFGTASLGVDAANPTGALSLYERLGFTVTRRRTSYVRLLD